jgi:hypothetical protein
MTLHDPHLQQALRHAPDRELGPDDATRKLVLDYAAQALKRQSPGWLQRVLGVLNPDSWPVAGWHLAGLGSAVVALLTVMVVIFHERAEDPLRVASVSTTDMQRKADTVPGALHEKQLAEVTPSAKPVPMASAKTSVLQAPAAKADAGQVVASVPATPEPAQKIVVASLPGPVDEHDAAVGGDAADKLKARSLAGEAAVVPPPASQVVALADAPERNTALGKSEVASTASAKKTMAAGEMRLENKDKAGSKVAVAPAAGAAALDGSAALSAARTKGAEHAARDIQSGMLRILTLEKSWPVGKPLVDEATGYKVEIVADRANNEVERAEMDAYNQTMREWHAAAGR